MIPNSIPTLIFHLALLFLWGRVWTDNDRLFFFNPYISGPMRVVDRVLAALRAPLPFLPNRALAALALALALAVKTLFWPVAGLSHNLTLCLRLEFESFFVFTFQVAAVQAILCLMSPRRPVAGRAAQVVEFAARPVSWIRPAALRLPVVAAGLFACHLLAYYFYDLPAGTPPGVVWKTLRYSGVFYNVAFSSVGVIWVWSRCVLMAVVVSWLGLVMPRSPVAACAREFSTALMGRLAGLLPVGALDLTPLVFFMAADALLRRLPMLLR